jgi:hypothetical protein
VASPREVDGGSGAEGAAVSVEHRDVRGAVVRGEICVMP